MTEDMACPGELIEAFAWWVAGLPEGRVVLAAAATDALVAGLDGLALAELAGITPSENPFDVDRLIERVAEDLDLKPEEWADAETLAARRMCRELLAGRLTERALSGWAHSQFHHESDCEPLNELALLDDEYDEVEYAGRDTSTVRRRIRQVAAAIVE